MVVRSSSPPSGERVEEFVKAVTEAVAPLVDKVAESLFLTNDKERHDLIEENKKLKSEKRELLSYIDSLKVAHTELVNKLILKHDEEIAHLKAENAMLRQQIKDIQAELGDLKERLADNGTELGHLKKQLADSDAKHENERKKDRIKRETERAMYEHAHAMCKNEREKDCAMYQNEREKDCAMYQNVLEKDRAMYENQLEKDRIACENEIDMLKNERENERILREKEIDMLKNERENERENERAMFKNELKNELENERAVYENQLEKNRIACANEIAMFKNERAMQSMIADFISILWFRLAFEYNQQPHIKGKKEIRYLSNLDAPSIWALRSSLDSLLTSGTKSSISAATGAP